MAKRKEHQEALRLRKLGKSYSEIKKITGVSKGTLSAWLKDFPLTEKRLRELRDWNQARIEHYRATREKRKNDVLEAIYQKERASIGRLSARELLVGGLFLYWGEGSKTRTTYLQIANTDPAIARAFIAWLEKAFGIAKDNITIRLHLYKDMNIAAESRFWVKALKIPLSSFRKPYIKNSAFSKLSYKSGFGHGTCNVILCNAMVAKRVLMGLRVLRDLFAGQ